ncbi:RNA polymerase sigma factor [Spirosoma arcticum]
MTTHPDNPCQRFDQDNLAFYEALRADYRQAWECLYMKTHRIFIPYACQRSAIDPDDALDILQDGLAEFAVNVKNGKYAFQGKPVTAYVFTVCRNRWATFLKKNQARHGAANPNVADTTQSLVIESAPSSSAFLSSDEADPESITATEPDMLERDAIWGAVDADWDAVGRAFAEVSADCQTMLRCFYVEEKSLSECGARIGLQENSAKVKRFRCAQRMKTLYIQYKRD